MKFHYLARAIIERENKILLVKEVGSKHTFLPGGHIKFSEPAKDALKRELLEETGLTATIKEFVGAVEHCWPSENQMNAEINLLFNAVLPNNCVVKSIEPNLEFLWVEKSNIEKYNLRPAPIKQHFIAKTVGAFWASTLNDIKIA